MKNKSLLLIAVLYLVVACSPKTGQQTVEKPIKKEEPIVNEDLSPCKNWKVPSKNDEAETNYVIYRDMLKNKDYERAFEYWQLVYNVAPAADGKRQTVYEDGVKLYNNLFSQSTDANKKKEYVAKIMKFYDEIGECYKTEGYAAGRKAFDYFYKYPEYSTDTEIYNLFTAAVDETGEKTPAFIINPFTSHLINLYLKEKVSLADAQKYSKLIPEALKYGKANCKGARECDPWNVVESYAPDRLAELEGVKGFYDCNYYTSKYLNEYEANPDDCETMEVVYRKLKWGGCSDSNPKLVEIKTKWESKCRVAVSTTTNPRCSDLLREGNYQEALDCYKGLADKTTDNERKASYYLVMAKIYYEIKNFGSSRKYALNAAKVKPNWAAPYELIGRLYASSGPKCGPGRGWDSQVVVWPAIDMWRKAMAVEPGSDSAEKARKLIARYKQYMPGIEDIFQRGLKEGDSFTVPCWIQQKTKIRAAPK